MPAAGAACATYIPPTAKRLQGPAPAGGTLTSTYPRRASAPPPTAKEPPSAAAATVVGGPSSIPAFLCKAVDASWAAERPVFKASRPLEARSGRRRAGCTPGAGPGAATPEVALPAYLGKTVVASAPPAEREEVSCHLDFAHGEGSARKRVRFADGKGPRGHRPVDDPQMREALANMAAKAKTAAVPRTLPAVPLEEPAVDSSLLGIIADISQDFTAYVKSKPSGDWDAIEEKEEAQAWAHAAALARELPERTIVRLLGGAAAAAQVPDREARADILVSALKSRGGPNGAGSRLALTAWRTLVHLTPAGTPTLPATAAFVARCKRAVDAAAKARCAKRKQGGATVVSRFEAGLFALASDEKGLGMDITITGIVAIHAVEKFVPEHREQAATMPVAQMVAVCRTARTPLPHRVARQTSNPGPALAAFRLQLLQATLRRYTARVVVLAWVFGLRFRHMQRFTPAADDVDPEGVISGWASLAKDGEPLQVFAPAMDILGAFSWFGEFLDEYAGYGNQCFPAFTAEWGGAGDPSRALELTGGFANDENSRKGLRHVMGVSEEVMKKLGVSWHSLHGSLADDGSVLATVPVDGYVITHDMLRCLGWWRRNARQNVDVAAAAASAGVIAARSRDFSVSVGLPSTLSEMLIRYSSGTGRNGVRARAIAARTAVLAVLAKGVRLIGEPRLATGTGGIRQVQDAVREALTAQRPA